MIVITAAIHAAHQNHVAASQDHVVHNHAAHQSVSQDISITTAATNCNLHAMHAKPNKQRDQLPLLVRVEDGEFWKNKREVKPLMHLIWTRKFSLLNMNHEWTTSLLLNI